MQFIKYIIIFTAIVVLGVTAGITIFFPSAQSTTEFINESTVKSTVKPIAKPIVKSNNEIIPSIPLSLEIPSINLKTSIDQGGLTESGKVEIPKLSDVIVWFNVGPKPGETGSAVISGHYGTWPDGSSSLFDNLHKLRAGDKVYVQDDNDQVFTFVVTDTKVYDANAIVPEIFNQDDDAYLNLITCSGQWLSNEQSFDERLVVFTKRF